jgi:hypothetical protein
MRGTKAGLPLTNSRGRSPPTNPTANCARIGAGTLNRGPAITCWTRGPPDDGRSVSPTGRKPGGTMRRLPALTARLWTYHLAPRGSVIVIGR